MMRPTTPIRFMLLAAGLALLLVIGADGALAKKAKPGEGYLLPAEIAGVVALPAPPPKASMIPKYSPSSPF